MAEEPSEWALREATIQVLCADDADWAKRDQLYANNAAIYEKVKAGAGHDGDCTKQSHTCLRCLVEDAEKRAPMIARALDAARQNIGEWRPIETAPKGEVLAYGPGGFKVGERFDSRIQGQWNAVINRRTGQFWPATHWMPLPEPPCALPSRRGTD